MVKKVLKWLAIGILSLVGLVLLIGFLFMSFSPQFGGEATEAQIQAYEQTGHFKDGVFINDEVIDMKTDCHSVQQMIKEMLEPDPNVAPKQDVLVQKLTANSILRKPDSLVRLTWLGHSIFLVEIEGKNILLDPIFGQYAAPHPLLGRKRYNSEMPISIAELPPIDIVLISHDHYDHLDYPSIKELKAKTSHFIVPLGVGNHLRAWDIAEEKISELDWWEEKKLDSMLIAFTPSRYMSGRGFGDQSATLWGSWVLKGREKNIYFSGDRGYGKHFAAIGETYGPFDIGLMECGQYNKLWEGVHMMPEETAQASLDIHAAMMVPIHWGSFTLATHSWTDPVERVTAKAKDLNIRVLTPKIGEPITMDEEPYPQKAWWVEYKNLSNSKKI